MNHKIRIFVLFLSSGAIWYYLMQLFFVWSGAQNILANPSCQSSKFLKVFIELEPFPRMATEKYFVAKGFFTYGLFLALAFVILNSFMKGGWLKRGLLFAAVQWLLMVPWFEFYLPYNVMNEPFSLVLFESLLWLGVNLSMGIIASSILNLRTSRHDRSIEQVH